MQVLDYFSQRAAGEQPDDLLLYDRSRYVCPRQLVRACNCCIHSGGSLGSDIVAESTACCTRTDTGLVRDLINDLSKALCTSTCSASLAWDMVQTLLRSMKASIATTVSFATSTRTLHSRARQRGAPAVHRARQRDTSSRGD